MLRPRIASKQHEVYAFYVYIQLMLNRYRIVHERQKDMTMKHTKLLILNLLVYAFCTVGVFAQNERPCFADAYDTDTELREFGMGKGETAFEALNAAITNAMNKIKPRCLNLYPNRKFEYSVMAKSTSDGDEVELDTTIGRPAIICNEIVETTHFTSYVVLSFEISGAQKDARYSDEN